MLVFCFGSTSESDYSKTINDGIYFLWMKSRLERLTVNAKVALVLLGTISASSDTAESEGRQLKQC